MDKILFIDRDGVINKDNKGYTFKHSEIEYNYDALDYIRDNFHDYIKIIVTNQSGIARGFYSEEDFQELMVYMVRDLEQYNIFINDVFYAPYMPGSEHPDRKPNPGMILRGLDKYKVKSNLCVMIGDKEDDYYAAKNAELGRFIYYIKGKINESKI